MPTMRYQSLFMALGLMAATALGSDGPRLSPSEITRVFPNVAPNLSLSSYANFKERHHHHADFPKDSRGYHPLTGDAQAFFKWPDGSEGLFLGAMQYWTPLGLGPAIPSSFRFFKKLNGQWQAISPAIEKRAENCVHPRKVIVADFNQDGQADFVVACHGHDERPFPGEHSISLMSTTTGYLQAIATDRIEFYHGGAAHDFNHDGFPDLVLTLKNGTRTFLNDGNGKFLASSEYSFGQFRRAFHIELVDVNEDGKFDVVGGSHEWEDATRIVVNPGNNKFGFFATTITVPPVRGAGTIVDFVYVKSNKSLYILRTGDGKTNGTTFYQGLWLQKFSLTDRLSSVLISDPGWSDPRYTASTKWLRWIVEDDGHIVSSWGQAIRVKIQ